MFKYILEVVFVIFGIGTILFGIFVVANIFPLIVPVLNILGALIAVVPPSYIFYTKYKITKEIEEEFIIFVKDLAQSINSGMTLPLALEQSTRKDYGFLNTYVKHMSAQVNWGIPFKKALTIFADKTRSIPIKRAVTTIVETYKVGGKIGDTLHVVGESLLTIDRIRKERTSSVHSQIVTSYLIYFVFIFILVLLQTFLLPALIPQVEESLTSDTPISTELFASGFVNFIIVQGFFAGLATGKMSEGVLVAGLKHSILLITIGYTVFSLAAQFQFQLF